MPLDVKAWRNCYKQPLQRVRETRLKTKATQSQGMKGADVKSAFAGSELVLSHSIIEKRLKHYPAVLWKPSQCTEMLSLYSSFKMTCWGLLWQSSGKTVCIHCKGHESDLNKTTHWIMHFSLPPFLPRKISQLSFNASGLILWLFSE